MIIANKSGKHIERKKNRNNSYDTQKIRIKCWAGKISTDVPKHNATRVLYLINMSFKHCHFLEEHINLAPKLSDCLEFRLRSPLIRCHRIVFSFVCIQFHSSKIYILLHCVSLRTKYANEYIQTHQKQERNTRKKRTLDHCDELKNTGAHFKRAR